MRLCVDKNDSTKFSVSNPKKFVAQSIPLEHIHKVIDFAYEMCFGQGHHRNHRTGGQYGRKNGEKFCNTFQGKLAEIVLWNFFGKHGFELATPDFNIYGEGIWDDSDLEIKGKKINVKSVASQSNLLLLEVGDWNLQGEYIPNLNNGATSTYDYFILVRISPDIKKLFKNKKWMFTNEISKEEILDFLLTQNWNFDIAGFITNEYLKRIINEKYILPQNAILNLFTKMDVANYYVQSGDMQGIEALISELKEMN